MAKAIAAGMNVPAVNASNARAAARLMKFGATAATRLAKAKAAMATISSRLRSTPAVATAINGEPKA